MTERVAFKRLGETDLTLASGERDVRGVTVKDAAGDELGTVEGIYVDTEERKARFLIVVKGGLLGFGGSQHLVPVEAIASVTDDGVRLRHARDDVEAAPRYDPRLVDQEHYWDEVYRSYGYAPYWGTVLIPPRGPGGRHR